MSEEIAELIAPEVPVETPVLADEPVPDPVEPVLDEPTAPPVHPLQPGGKRFEQVYAQAKQTQRDLADERERRIRAEAQLEVLNKKTAPATTEYSVDDLEAMIATGSITRADAVRHREEVLSKSISERLKREQQNEIALNNRVTALSNGIQTYLSAVPDVGKDGTPLKARVDQEFDFLVAVQGKDATTMTDVDRKAIALVALRNVLGPVETLAKRVASPVADTHQGSFGGTPTQKKSNPDQKILDGLSKVQVAHYNRMFTLGKYPGRWKDVVAELKFDPTTRARK